MDTVQKRHGWDCGVKLYGTTLFEIGMPMRVPTRNTPKNTLCHAKLNPYGQPEKNSGGLVRTVPFLEKFPRDWGGYFGEQTAYCSFS